MAVVVLFGLGACSEAPVAQSPAPEEKPLEIGLYVDNRDTPFTDSNQRVKMDYTWTGKVSNEDGCRFSMKVTELTGEEVLNMKLHLSVDEAGKYYVNGTYDSTTPFVLELEGTAQAEDQDLRLELKAGEGKVQATALQVYTYEAPGQ